MDLFPTLLEEYDLTEAPGLEYLKEYVKSSGKNNEHSLAVNGVSSHGGWDPLDDDGCRPMIDVFHECLNDYNTKIGNYPVILSGSWYNILPKGGYTATHRHESSVISGAFYLQLPEGDFGQFFVVSPLKPYMMCIHNIQPTPYGVYEIDIPIKENHLYLFPSWLEHGSRVNNTEGERITMSFNTSAAPREMLPDSFLEAVWGPNWLGAKKGAS